MRPRQQPVASCHTQHVEVDSVMAGEVKGKRRLSESAMTPPTTKRPFDRRRPSKSSAQQQVNRARKISFVVVVFVRSFARSASLLIACLPVARLRLQQHPRCRWLHRHCCCWLGRKLRAGRHKKKRSSKSQVSAESTVAAFGTFRSLLLA